MGVKHFNQLVLPPVAPTCMPAGLRAAHASSARRTQRTHLSTHHSVCLGRPITPWHLATLASPLLLLITRTTMRLAGWEFFVKRWTMMAEAVSGLVSSAAQAQAQVLPQLSATEVRRCSCGGAATRVLRRLQPPVLPLAQAAKLDVVLKKAVRARQLLHQVGRRGRC